MPTARTKANRKYNEKAYDRVEITVAKGDKDKIKAFAEEKGLSMNAFINAAIQEKIKKEKDAEV